jgi:hypothetical protein
MSERNSWTQCNKLTLLIRYAADAAAQYPQMATVFVSQRLCVLFVLCHMDSPMNNNQHQPAVSAQAVTEFDRRGTGSDVDAIKKATEANALGDKIAVFAFLVIH